MTEGEERRRDRKGRCEQGWGEEKIEWLDKREW